MSSKAERAAARRSWPVRKTTLDEEDMGFVEGPPGELVAMVWRLTQDAWAMSGRPYPVYARSEMPGRLLRATPVVVDE